MFIDIWPEVSERARRAAEERANKAEGELAVFRPRVVKLEEWLEQACDLIQMYVDGGLGDGLKAWYEERLSAAAKKKREDEFRAASERLAKAKRLRDELDEMVRRQAELQQELEAVLG